MAHAILADFNILDFSDPSSVLLWVDTYCKSGGLDAKTNEQVSKDLTEQGFDYAAKLDSDNADVYARYIIGLCISSLAHNDIPTKLLEVLMPNFNRLQKIVA